MVKSRNDVKVLIFNVSCHNSPIFEGIDLIFCTHIYQSLLFNIYSGFVRKHFFRGKLASR